MEFALIYGTWELLRHDKILETHVLAILLTGIAWLLYGKKILAYQVSTSYFKIFRFWKCASHRFNGNRFSKPKILK